MEISNKPMKLPKPHTYLLAYMAGLLLPSWLLLLVPATFATGRIHETIPGPIEQIIIFPMAAIPNLWGLWNTLYVALPAVRRLTLGLWGALLPLVLVPAALMLQRSLNISVFTSSEVLAALPVIVAMYYLAWKHIVGFFNRVTGVDEQVRIIASR
jgi:hypothetical protein